MPDKNSQQDVPENDKTPKEKTEIWTFHHSSAPRNDLRDFTPSKTPPGVKLPSENKQSEPVSEKDGKTQGS